MENNTYYDQQKLAVLNFISELPNFIVIVISAICTSSLVVWMDFMDSFICVFRAFLVILIARMLKSNLRYKYNYGIGKIEAFSSVVGDIILILSMILIAGFAVLDIFNPKQPSGLLIAVVPIKMISVGADAWFYYKQKKIFLKANTKVTKSELVNAQKNLAFDSLTLVTVFMLYVFRNVHMIGYVSPVFCLILSFTFIYYAVQSIRGGISELLDETAQESEQFQILKMLAKFHDRFDSLMSINTRYIGDKLNIDLTLGFEPETTYQQINAFVDDVYTELEKEIPNCQVNVVIAGSE